MVLMPLYCTVLKTFEAVTRASKERVSPSCMVRESAAVAETVPGPSMEFREAVPKPLAGGTNAGVLKKASSLPAPWIGCEKYAVGPLRVVAARQLFGCAGAVLRRKVRACGEGEGAAQREAVHCMRDAPPLLKNARLGPKGSSNTQLPVRLCR